MTNKYVLSDQEKEELHRLEFQHEVWKTETGTAIQRGAVKKGDHIIDLGCGPGFLSYDLAQLVGKDGSIYAVENSGLFIEYIKNQKYENIKPIKADITTDLPQMFRSLKIAAVFCRWVLMFIENSSKVIQDIYNLLPEGGRFVSLEYFRFRHIDIFPRSRHFNQIYDCVYQLISANGGDPDVGGRIYEMMQAAGFRQIEIHPVYRSGRAGSPLWQWMEMNNRNHTNLVEAGLINGTQLKQYYKDWQQRSGNKLSFVTAPPLMITSGIK